MANVTRFNPLAELTRFDPFREFDEIFRVPRSFSRAMPEEPQIRMDVTEDEELGIGSPRPLVLGSRRVPPPTALNGPPHNRSCFVPRSPSVSTNEERGRNLRRLAIGYASGASP